MKETTEGWRFFHEEGEVRAMLYSCVRNSVWIFRAIGLLLYTYCDSFPVGFRRMVNNVILLIFQKILWVCWIVLCQLDTGKSHLRRGNLN